MKLSMFDTGRYFSRRSRLSLTTLALMAGLTGLAAGAAEAATMPGDNIPAGTRVMTPFEIYVLYRDKNWQWADGSGQMVSADRRFTARVDGEKGKAWAEGRWMITKTGRMCFKADWHTEKGKFPAKTCFSHRIGDGAVYQKREPNGVWYVFRHADGRVEDEARKLISISLASEKKNGELTAAEAAQQSPKQ
ncbi:MULTISPECIES: DUF995 domain-containing protein [Brucella/Ochrobactrum group]|uniref:DUF995 domain-containing protein n=2 Tax=Ochrobactrum TaxID=528 RepID=A0ABD5JUQ5_9HYPH|nr:MULTISPECIES: DUF995 domain-containing protein [Brucella]MDX4073062.1 DUF995 domain-containing protein [Brucella sp. NBRC 113783]SPL65276.1 hypothetical protein OHAE_1143 [[Ochrobactrum] soli]